MWTDRRTQSLAPSRRTETRARGPRTEHRSAGRSRARRRRADRASALDVRERGRGADNDGIGRSGKPPLIELPNDSDELALDTDIVIELGRIGGVGWLEPDLVLLLEEALERDRVLVDLGNDDVPIAG